MGADASSLQEQVAAFLRRVARARATTTYAEVAAVAGLTTGDPASRDRIARLLAAINAGEHTEGRPLLSAVVVFAGQRRPGAGFFRCARDLGRLPESGAPLAFWLAELQRVYAQWGDEVS